MHSTLGGRAAALLLVLFVIAACADPATAPATTGPAGPAATTPTAPTTAAPGACAWRSRVDQAQPGSDSAQSGSGAAAGDQPGDMPPNHADNRRWRQREGVTDPEAQTLAALAPDVRRILTEACRRGDFSPARIQQELSAIAPPGGSAWATQRVSASGDASTAVDGFVQVGRACLIVALEPEQIIVEATTVIADGGCWEPASH